MMPVLRERLARVPLAEVTRIFEENGLPFAPITRPEQLFEDPHLLETGGLAEMEIPIGARAGERARAPLLPMSFDGRRLGVRHDPPYAGEHTRGLLAELGYAPTQIEAMLASDTVLDQSDRRRSAKEA